MKTFKTPKGTELPLMDLKGKDYLQPAYRVVWLKEEHPEWTIETEFLVREPEYTIAKAIIKDGIGKIIATAHKSDHNKQFHLERAETGAVGRCAAFCGYGTAFAFDIDEEDNFADAPLDSKKESKQNLPSIPKFNIPSKFSDVKEESFDDQTIKQSTNPPQSVQQQCSCGNKMMISKFPDSAFPTGFYYCAKCKSKKGIS